MVADANMSNNPENLKEICNLLIKNKNDIPWFSQHRADRIVKNPNLVKLMKKAGAKFILIGYESMSKKILDYYSKETKMPSMNLKALNILKKNNIICQGSHIIGAPGETLKEMIKTIMFAFKSDYPTVGLLKSYPGSAQLHYSGYTGLKPKNRDYTNFKEINLYSPLWVTGILQKLFLLLAYLNPKRLLTLVSPDISIRMQARFIYLVLLSSIYHLLRIG